MKQNARVALATAEAARSNERLRIVRERVVKPLREARDRNQFSDMLRASLIAGHDKKNGAV